MLTETATLVTRALETLRGDDLYRARAAFGHLTEKELDLPHGESGSSRRQILEGYLNRDAMIDNAKKDLGL
jgi:hypothetical protein